MPQPLVSKYDSTEECKLVPLYIMQGQGLEKVQLLLIHDLGTKRGWVVSVTSWPRLTPVTGPAVPIGQEAG
jgi:hypothetical protein